MNKPESERPSLIRLKSRLPSSVRGCDAQGHGATCQRQIAPAMRDEMDHQSGQALVEFVIALIGILVLTAGILFLGEAQQADTESLVEATASAVEDSMRHGIPNTFTPLRDWDAGRDGLRHTKDDRAQHGNWGSLRTQLGGRSFLASGGTGGASLRPDGSSLRYDNLERFQTGAQDASTFHFHRGQDTRTLTPPTVLERLLGLPSTLTLRNEVWMPSTTGLY